MIATAILLKLLLMTWAGEGSFQEQALLADWKLERYEWAGELSGIQQIEIVNEHGDVRVRTRPDNRVELSAVIQRAPTGSGPQFEHDEDRRRFAISVRFPDPAVSDQGTPKRRVDIVAVVPADIPLVIRTIEGLIEARGLKREFEAATVRGDVRVRSESPCRIVSEQGDVLVSLSGGDWTSPILVETSTGDIRVELPQESSLHVEVATAGELTTDYSMEISWKGLRKQGVARIGGGDARMTLRSENGGIKLIRRKIN